MRRTKTWVLLLGAAAALCLAAGALVELFRPPAVTAEVWQDGVLLRSIDLTAVDAPWSFTVEAPNGGTNVISVEPGRVCVSQASCPDQICVRQGWVSDGVVPIVCLPNHLTIQLKGGGTQLDAATG